MIKHAHGWVQHTMPLTMDDSLSHQEFLGKILCKVNELVDYLNNLKSVWEDYTNTKVAELRTEVLQIIDETKTYLIAYSDTVLEEAKKYSDVARDDLQTQIDVVVDDVAKNRLDFDDYKKHMVEELNKVYAEMKRQYDALLELAGGSGDAIKSWVLDQLKKQLDEFSEILADGYFVKSPITHLGGNVDKVLIETRDEATLDYQNMSVQELQNLGLTLGDIANMALQCGESTVFPYPIFHEGVLRGSTPIQRDPIIYVDVLPASTYFSFLQKKVVIDFKNKMVHVWGSCDVGAYSETPEFVEAFSFAVYDQNFNVIPFDYDDITKPSFDLYVVSAALHGGGGVNFVSTPSFMRNESQQGEASTIRVYLNNTTSQMFTFNFSVPIQI